MTYFRDDKVHSSWTKSFDDIITKSARISHNFVVGSDAEAVRLDRFLLASLADQTIATATETPIAPWTAVVNKFPTDDVDLTNGEVTASVDGIYRFRACLSLTDTATTGTRRLALYVSDTDGANFAAVAAKLIPGVNGTFALDLEKTLSLSAGQVAEFRLLQNSGGNVTINAEVATIDASYIEVTMLP